MAKLLIQGIVFMTIIAIVVAVVQVSNHHGFPGKRKRLTYGVTLCKNNLMDATANIQSLPSDCTFQIDVDKRNKDEVDFITCVKNGEICTSRDVVACSSFKVECESFEPPADQAFKDMFPKAYAKVCVEPSSGEQCLFTDVTYKTCSEAKIMGENEVCITLSDGEVECSEIPQKYLAELMLQNARKSYARINDDGELPQYKPPKN